MEPMALHEFHRARNARFADQHGTEAVSHYGDALSEHAALRQTAGALDLSFRSRLCLVGADRVRFLHGQVTNDVKRLREGEGCYAALVTAKGKMQSDLNVYCLRDELLLDFEPGLAAGVAQRLEKYIVADDVQVVDVAAQYGLWTVHGPRSEEVIRHTDLFPAVPSAPHGSVHASDATLGELYLMQHRRLGMNGFDLFIPLGSMNSAAGKLTSAVEAVGGRLCGIEDRAISYNKGCYIGQEVINRIHSIGRVNRQLRGLRFNGSRSALPAKGDLLFSGEKEAGYVTSSTRSPLTQSDIALAYVRREWSEPGTRLMLRSAGGGGEATVAALPFSA
jgi:glycine cleavage system aminomethyltransferase T